MNSAVRSTLAYILLAVFVVATTIGGWLVSAAVGWFCLGGTSGVAGWLLGLSE